MSSVKLNSVVELTEQHDKMPAGRVGRVLYYNDIVCVVGFDNGNNKVDGKKITHNKYPFLADYPSSYIVETGKLKITNKTCKVKPIVTKTCKCCGSVVEAGKTAHKMSNGSFICDECFRNKNYSYKNNIAIGKIPKGKKRTFGFEFECVPKNDSCKANIVGGDMNIVPTDDASLPSGGVEFKSPTYNSMRGLRRVFKTMSNNVDFSSERCGQHINIGDRDYINSMTLDYLKCHTSIFENLKNYMKENPEQTEHVCGRYFRRYCTDNSSYCHGSWLNLEKDNRIEFRISKFVTPTQYLNLTQMWSEMIDVLIEDAIKPWYTPGKINHKPNPIKFMINEDRISSKLISVFNKYENKLKKLEELENNNVQS